MTHRPETPRRGGRARSQRQLRLGEVLRHALVEALERDSIRDPDLANVSVTVTEVRVSPDLRNATVFVVPLGGAHMDVVVAALRRAAPYLRRLVAARVVVKRLPALRFEPDTSFDRFDRLGRLLRGAEVPRDVVAAADGTETGKDGP